MGGPMCTLVASSTRGSRWSFHIQASYAPWISVDVAQTVHLTCLIRLQSWLLLTLAQKKVLGFAHKIWVTSSAIAAYLHCRSSSHEFLQDHSSNATSLREGFDSRPRYPSPLKYQHASIREAGLIAQARAIYCLCIMQSPDRRRDVHERECLGRGAQSLTIRECIQLTYAA